VRSVGVLATRSQLGGTPNNIRKAMEGYRVIVAGFALAAALALLLARCSQIGRRPKDFPPGPPTIPVLGNLHLVSHIAVKVIRLKVNGICRCQRRSRGSSSRLGQKNAGMRTPYDCSLILIHESQTYIFAYLGHQNIYCAIFTKRSQRSTRQGTSTLHIPRTMPNLCAQRASIYSSRPDMYMAQDIASGGLRLVTMVCPDSHSVDQSLTEM